MTELIRPDICIIGAGAGGLSVARAAAALGAATVLIEKGKMGGECLHSGCVPSKALMAAAARAHALRNSARFGIKPGRTSIDFAAVNKHVHDVIAAVARNDSRERFTALGVRVIEGTARFTDEATVAVDDVAIKARRFVVATGSSPLVPAIPGLLDTPHLTNENVFDLTECPRHLVVIGAGVVGLELAQAFRRLGADVTVLEAQAPLAGFDPECVALVLKALERDGVTLRTGVEVAKISRTFAKINVLLAKADGIETIEASHVLVATGRRPNLEDVGLEAAGVRYEPHGIVVDETMSTSNKRIYAVGDVTGGPRFTHAANYHAGLVVRHALFRLPVRMDLRRIPAVLYTDPELAHVGMTEDDARARARRSSAVRTLRWPYLENDRAQAERTTSGHIKVITDARGVILGVTIVGARATENIAAWTLAISQKLKIRAMAELVVPYPTYSEIGKSAAISYFQRRLTSPRVRRIMAWLRRFGG